MNNAALLELRQEYSKPFILYVASMAIGDIGRTAKKIDKEFQKAFRKHDSIRLEQLGSDATQLILGLRLRLARNMLNVAGQESLKEVADYHHISVKELEEIHFINFASDGLDALTNSSTGYTNVNEFISANGFMPGVMEIIERSNEVLKVVSDS